MNIYNLDRYLIWSLRNDDTWSWYSITTKSRNDLQSRSMWMDMMIFCPWSLMLCTTFIWMTDPIFLSPGILRWILDRRSLLQDVYTLQRLHVHLTDLNLWWSKPSSLPFLFPLYQIKKHGDLTVLDITVNVFFFFFQISVESVVEISYHSQSRYREVYFNYCYAVRWKLTWIWSRQRIVLIQRSDIASIYGSLIRSKMLFWDFFHSNSIASPSIP